MSDTAISRYLSVDVAALLLVKIDFGLEDVDFLGGSFELRSVLILLLLKVALLLLVLVIVEDLLVGTVELPVEG